MDGCSLVFIWLGRSQGEGFTLVLNTRAKSQGHLAHACGFVDVKDIAQYKLHNILYWLVHKEIMGLHPIKGK